MKTIALICAYNEEKHIKEIIEKTLKHVPDVLIVNDGSIDNTVNEVKKTKAKIVNHEINKGKGEALKTGFNYCLKNGYENIITLDGDGQHDPNEIPLLLNKMNEGYDIVIGTRKRNKMPIIRKISNTISSNLVSKRANIEIKDSQSGFRVINSEILKNLNLEASNFDLESEILIKAAKKGYKIGNENITTIYADERSKMHPIKDTLRFFKVINQSKKW
ncbi:MAG TPA: glycosyltransferase family 2 protein [Candidatus Nanoarchaeia archaeon]|nr:glycosyltransferase family 2 protein [Candidatus Nanoarchaeia archaeon]